MKVRTKILIGFTALALSVFPSCSTTQEEPVVTPNLNFTHTPEVPTSTPEPTPTPKKFTEIATLTELRDYLNEQVAQGNLQIAFECTGNKSQMTAQNMARMVNAMFIRTLTEDSRPDVIHVSVIQFPGDRIVAAYKSGDTSTLTDAELRALKKAEGIVENARKSADNDIELELAIHDWMLKNISVNYDSANFDDPENAPRHVSALGALLNASASSQGYVDCFYTLASIAGLQVGRMSVETKDGGYHMVNTICLDGAWYVVDVMYDDSLSFTDGTNPATYRLFNAGKDQCVEYSWGSAMEYHPIAAESDSHYYYNLPEDISGHGYEKKFKYISDAAKSIVKEWNATNRKEFQIMFTDRSIQYGDLNLHLQRELNATGKGYSYTSYISTNGKDTFFLIRFT